MRTYRRAVIRAKIRGTLPFLAGDELSEACGDTDSPDIVVAHESCDARRDEDRLGLATEFDASEAEFHGFALATSSKAARFWSATDRKSFHNPWPSSSHTTGALNSRRQAMVPSFSSKKP